MTELLLSDKDELAYLMHKCHIWNLHSLRKCTSPGGSVVELPLRVWKVAGSIPGRDIPKVVIKMVSISLAYARHSR